MEITNSRILNFFKNHPKLNIEKLLLHFIDFYESISPNLNSDNLNNSFDYSIVIDSIQQKLNNLLTPYLLSEQTTLSNIYSQLSQITTSHKIPSLKGKITENNYLNFLSSCFSDSEVADCSAIPHSMDILIKQLGQIDIRFDIKDYSTNVPTKEIQKFKNDIQYNMCHGILISDKSGIATKKNYSFDVIDNKYIAFYVSHGNSHLNNLPDIISFIRCLESIITTNSGIHISQNSIEIIQKELSHYISCIDTIKSNLQNSIQLCNKMSFSTITNILQYSNNTLDQSKFVCSNCNETFATKRKLTYHLKTHSASSAIDSNS